MKILVTGTNAPHIGSDRVPWKYATGVEALVRTLELSNEVEWRAVTPGEDLSLQRYDKVMCVLGPPSALTAQYLYGVLWALWSRRGDIELIVDDWQTHQIVNGYRTVARNFDRLWRPILNRKCREEAGAVKAQLEQAVTMVASQNPWPWRVWAPMFPVHAAKPELLGLPTTRWALFDPTSYWWDRRRDLQCFRVPDEEREKVWISASLLNKQPWLKKRNFSWPVYSFGNKKLQQPRVKETEIIKLYGQSWGVISCPHNHVGSGWWRNRYQFAAMMGAVVYGSNKETEFYGDSYRESIALGIESMSLDQIRDVAFNQRSEYLARSWSKEELHDFVNKGIQR
jgi:hypothetical protein